MWGRMRSSSLKPRPPERGHVDDDVGHFSRTRPTVFAESVQMPWWLCPLRCARGCGRRRRRPGRPRRLLRRSLAAAWADRECSPWWSWPRCVATVMMSFSIRRPPQDCVHCTRPKPTLFGSPGEPEISAWMWPWLHLREKLASPQYSTPSSARAKAADAQPMKTDPIRRPDGTSQAWAELPTGKISQPREDASSKQSMPTASMEGRAIRLCRHFCPARTAQSTL